MHGQGPGHIGDPPCSCLSEGHETLPMVRVDEAAASRETRCVTFGLEQAGENPGFEGELLVGKRLKADERAEPVRYHLGPWGPPRTGVLLAGQAAQPVGVGAGCAAGGEDPADVVGELLVAAGLHVSQFRYTDAAPPGQRVEGEFGLPTV